MSAPAPSPQKVHLQELAAFSQRLLAALRESGTADRELADLLNAGLEIECLQCGIRLTGRDLLDLAGAGGDEALEDNPKVGRLRQGYCARSGCQSYYYGVTWVPGPGLDWTKIIARADHLRADKEQSQTQALRATRAARRSAGWRQGLKITAAAGVVLVLLLIRQWFSGGTVPFLREPRKFEVDPTSLDPIALTNRPATPASAPFAVDAE